MLKRPANWHGGWHRWAWVESDDGAPLAVGQRIVTREGKLRRWDGYVATDQGAAAAERLVRLNRLVALQAERDESRTSVEQARSDASTAQARMEAARAAADAGRRAHAEADNRARLYARDVDCAAAALERLAARRAEVAERLERVQGDVSEAEGETRAAHAARLALPDGSETARTVSTLQSGAEAARASVAQLRAEASGLDRAIADDQSRLGSAQGEMRDWKSRAGEAAKRIDEMTKRARAVEAEALSLADAPAHLDERIATLSAAVAHLTAEATAAAEGERAAETLLRETEAKAAEAGEALSAAREARAGAICAGRKSGAAPHRNGPRLRRTL